MTTTTNGQGWDAVRQFAAQHQQSVQLRHQQMQTGQPQPAPQMPQMMPQNAPQVTTQPAPQAAPRASTISPQLMQTLLDKKFPIGHPKRSVVEQLIKSQSAGHDVSSQAQQLLQELGGVAAPPAVTARAAPTGEPADNAPATYAMVKAFVSEVKTSLMEAGKAIEQANGRAALALEEAQRVGRENLALKDLTNRLYVEVAAATKTQMDLMDHLTASGGIPAQLPPASENPAQTPSVTDDGKEG